MIITDVIKADTRDVSAYAWSRISQFHNSDYTAEAITRLHRLDKKGRQNAKKQAEQIRHCLIQAQEYFNAARSVSLATKPVLLYYCVMSLALAEVLLKQTADSRLSRLREVHNCHGLTLSLTSDPLEQETFEVSSSKLLAKVQRSNLDKAKGTFEVWRKSAREHPIAGLSTVTHGGGNIQKFQMLMIPEDNPPPVIGSRGVTLFECVVNLPYMGDILSRWGARLNMVRASLEQNQTKNNLVITVHPAAAELLEKFADKFQAQPSLVNSIAIQEMPSGWILTVDLAGCDNFTLPHATTIFEHQTFFSCSDLNLGEFGFLYASLHMLGNFARYYPDKWIRHIDARSPLASVADELCIHAMDRLPLLTLSELTRVYHVLGR